MAANMAPGRGSVRLRMDHLADLQPLLGTRLEAGSIVGSRTLQPLGDRTETQPRARRSKYHRRQSLRQRALDGHRARRRPVL